MSVQDRQRAAMDGDLTQLKLLVSVAKGNVEDDVSGIGAHMTVLYYACLNGHVECVKWLLEHCDANVDARSRGTSPLMQAAYSNKADICKVLIQHNADIEATTNTGHNALWFALSCKKDDCVPLLIEKGAIIANVVLDHALIAIPHWVHSFIAQREQCRQCAIVLLGSLRKGRVSSFRGNGKDVATIISKMMWDTRNTDVWAGDHEELKGK